MIHHDNRMWKRNFKFGHLPGDISIASKIHLFNGNSVQGCSIEAARGYRKEVVKKANRTYRHSFKNEELKNLLDELE